ncbi:AMP-binding protein [Microbacterium sp. zg.B48]|uniref:class I adenylate-forming enzyme family protein n=1 Tax=Microbacterium sp. zg.B48 TaxID=2969408 RepID=UPI00214AB2F0|nr:AMP-binding protein [Microbacterium sp. zg.B48]MCR2764365.1 AMP-binding protein [Microbacterium sp. zg.B48]
MNLDDDLVAARKRSVWQTVAENAANDPHKIAYLQVDDDHRRRSLTYADVADQASRLAEGLYSIGVRRGDRVAIWMTNRPEWILTYLAVLRLGATLVPLNTWLKAPEVAYLLKQSEARHLVILDRFRRIDFVEEIASIAPEIRTAPRSGFWSPELPELRNIVVLQRSSDASYENLHQWNELAAGDSASSAAAEAISASVGGDDLAIIKYTSGSTGRPKGVMLEQGAIEVWGRAHSERAGLTSDDIFFSSMPFFHSGGSMWGIHTMQAVGGLLVFTEAFDPQLAGELIESERATVMFGILANELVTVALQAGRDFSSVQISRPGGKGMKELMPNLRLIINPYGQTEAMAAATLCGPEDPMERQSATNGRALRGNEVKVVDIETGQEAARGVIGEAWIRGNVMRGYWKLPEETAKAIDEDGWVHTEDLISMDEDGYVTFEGRLKLMLKVGGENVSVEEVERAIVEHDAVLHCVVVGVPDQRKTEIGRAYVVLHQEKDLDGTTLLEWLSARLARFKLPRDIEIVESLPVLGNAKYDRVRIQQLALQNAPVAADA